MVKAKQASIRADRIDGISFGEIRGDCDEIAVALLDVFSDAGANNRDIRKTLRRMARTYLRESRPRWVDRLMFDLCGAAVICGGVYGVCAVLNWISGVLL